MNQPADVFSSPLIVFAVLFLVTFALFIIAYVFKHLVDQHKKLQEEKKELESALRNQSKKTIEHSESQAREILASAREQAKNEISRAELLTEHMKLDFKKAFDELFKNQSKQYEKLIDSFRKDAALQFSTTQKEQELLAKKVNTQYEELLEEVHKGAAQKLDTYAASLKEGIDREVEAYRTQKLTEIKKESLEWTKQFAKKVLGKTLTYEDHEQIILQAFEELKHELTS